MTLGDLIEQEGATSFDNPYRYYPYNPWEDQLWEWFDELQDYFPVEIRCDFIEVSQRIRSYHAKAYYRDNGTHQFIRFAEYYVDDAEEWRIKRTLLHEMVHLYTYQMGHHDVSDSSVIFKWLCGAVGAEVNQIHNGSDVWEDLAEPFIEDDRDNNEGFPEE